MKTPIVKPRKYAPNNLSFQLDLKQKTENKIKVPFLRPELTEEEIEEVVQTLKSGWLTTGPKTKLFEDNFAKAVNAKYAVAVNSCTAALHLAAEAVGLQAGQAVLIPTMTFAATAEILLYKNAIPILVDCDPETGNMDLLDARRKIRDIRAGKMPFDIEKSVEIVGIIPVHVGGFMINIDEIESFANEFDLWIIEDAAHAFPSAWRKNSDSPWQFCGENTAKVTCFSFYANKTITTGEGGMAVTNNEFIAEKIRILSLHGLSRDAWKRYSGNGSWDYRIITPGYKYNLTDIAASIGIHQLARAEEMRKFREKIANIYLEKMADFEQIELPPVDENRIHSWHLFPVRLVQQKITINRNKFIEELKKRDVGYSVHWRPLHLHPFYSSKYGWRAKHLPNASQLWARIVSLPIFPGMTDGEIEHVINSVREICFTFSKREYSLVA